MQGVWETIDFTWRVFIGSIELLGYMALAFAVYIMAIELHEQHIRRRIRREARDEARAERFAHGLRSH